MKKIFVFIIAFFCLMLCCDVKAKDYVLEYDEYFKSGELSIHTDVSISNDDDFSNIVYSVYNTSKSIDSNNYLYIGASNCSYERKTCDFNLNKHTLNPENNVWEGQNIKTYENIKILLDDNLGNYFSFVDDKGEVNINYDEDMFSDENEKNMYISNYLNQFNDYSSSDYFKTYQYDSWYNRIKYVEEYNRMPEVVAIKKISKFNFEFIDTEYSEDFKKLTSGTITIKSDAPLTDEILSSYLSNFHANNYYFSVDGNIANNKAFIKLMQYQDNTSVEAEKHLVNINIDNNIDISKFNAVDMGDFINIKADEPNDKSRYIENYLNVLRFYKEEGDYQIRYDKRYIYNTDEVLVSYIKKLSKTNELKDYEVHKTTVKFVGYDNNYSDLFKNKVGTELLINSSVKNETVIGESLNYEFRVLSCNSDYSKCDIAYYDDKTNSVEIHSVDIKFDDTMTDNFIKSFNVKNKSYIDIIHDAKVGISHLYYSDYDEKNNINRSYSCDSNQCTLTLKNYKTNLSETHVVDYNEIIDARSNYFNNMIYDKVEIYLGENNNIWNYLNYGNLIFSKKNNYVSANGCRVNDKVCEAILLNDSNTLEIHDVNIELKDGISPEFNKLVPNNTLKLNAVYIDDEDYIVSVSMAQFMSTSKTWSYLENYNNGKGIVRYNGLEKHTVSVEFETTDEAKKKKIDNVLEKLNQKDIEIVHEDMDFVNTFYYDDLDGTSSNNYDSTNLEEKVNKIVNDKHISYFYQPRAGSGGALYSFNRGHLILYYDGIAYNQTTSNVIVQNKHIIYIPDDTNENSNDYIKAAQKRIDDYLGKNSGVIITLSTDDYSLDLDELDIDMSKFNNEYYQLNYGDRNCPIIILKDSKKMKNSKFLARDVNNNVKVRSDNVNYPSNTVVASKRIDSDEYKRILNNKNLEVIDIDLYSSKIGVINDFDNSNFEVSVPLINDYSNLDNLYAYYIDDDGNIEEHKITVNDGVANFETTHFSTYIIGEKMSKKEMNEIKDMINPQTGDNITIYICTLIISILGLLLLIKLNIKKSK